MSETQARKPCAAEKLIGTHFEANYGRNPRKRHHVKGTITKWRYGYGVVVAMKPNEDGTPRECWPEVQLLVKPDDGGRAVWVGPFKDGNNPGVYGPDLPYEEQLESGQLITTPTTSN